MNCSVKFLQPIVTVGFAADDAPAPPQAIRPMRSATASETAKDAFAARLVCLRYTCPSFVDEP